MATIPVRILLEAAAGEYRISLSAFLKAAQESETILREIDRTLAGEKLHWYFVELGIGSGIATISGDWEAAEGDRVLTDDEYRRTLEETIPARFVDGLALLDKTPGAWPEDFTEDAIEAAARLARLVNGYVSSISVSAPQLKKSTRITERVIANVRELSVRQYVDAGSLEGVVESISATRSPYTFGIRDPFTGRLVNCSFSLDLLEQVRQSLLRRVSVRGQIRYSEDGLPIRMTGIQSISLLPDSQFDSASRIVGIAPGLTQELDPYEYLRREWDEQ